MDLHELETSHATYIDMDNPSKLIGCCPYCGGDMFLNVKKTYNGENITYRCSKCYARSPIAKNEDDAHLLAIQVMDSNHPYCVMWRDNSKEEWKEVGVAGSRADMLDFIAHERIDHGDECQFKLRRLTDEEVKELMNEDDECGCCHGGKYED